MSFSFEILALEGLTPRREPEPEPVLVDTGSTFFITDEPDWIHQHEIAWNTPGTGDEPGLILLMDSQYSPVRQTIYERWVRRLSTAETVKKFSVIEIEYDPETQYLCIHHIIVWRGDQSQDVTESGRFVFRQRGEMVETPGSIGRVSARLELEGLEPDDVVECAYSIMNTRQWDGLKIDYSFLLERDWPTGVWYVSVFLPRGIQPRYWQSDGGQLKAKIIQDETETVWVWSGRQENPSPEEIGLPSWEAPFLWAHLSGYQNWTEVAQVIENNWNKVPLEGANAKMLAEQLAPGAELETRALEVLRWVQDEIRYVHAETPLGGLLPNAPDEVLQRRYGDSTEKSLLLCQLLRFIGVEAHCVLVHAQWLGTIAQHLPALSRLNHVIVTYTIKGRRGFADPSLLGAGGGLFDQSLPFFERGLALGLPSTGLIEIIPSGRDKSRCLVQEEFFLDNRGTGSHLVTQIVATGNEADHLRMFLTRHGWDAFLQREAADLQRYFPDLQPMTSLQATDNRDTNTLTLDAKFALADWGREISPKIKVFSYEPRWIIAQLICPPEGPRRHNFLLQYPLDVRHEIRIHSRLFAGKAEKLEVSCHWFQSSCTLTWKASHSASLNYSYQNKLKFIQAAQLPNFIREFQKVAKALRCQIQVEWHGPKHLETPVLGLEEETADPVRKPLPSPSQPLPLEEVTLASTAPPIALAPVEVPLPAPHPLWKWVAIGGVFVLILSLAGAGLVLRKMLRGQNRSQTEASLPHPMSPTTATPPSRVQLDSKVNVPTGNIDFKPVQIAFQQNDIPKAAALLTEMEKAYPQNPVVHGLWGMLELGRKNFVAARQRADTSLKIAPDYALGHVILGNLSLIEKKWTEAEARFLSLTQKQPDLYEAWQGLALARNGLGNSALAEQAAQKMHDLQPGNFEALRLAVLYHSNRGDTAGALALIDETLKQKPDLASARSLRVNLLDSNGQTKEALEEVDVLIAQNPSIPLLVAQRSRLLARLGRLAEAEQAATTAINATPNDYGTNEEAGQAYALCQKFPEAIASHLKCVELKPEEASAHQKLGYTYWLAGNKDRARASLERAVELSPKYLIGWKTLATICEDTGDTARLAQCQAKIMELEAKPSPSTP